MNGKQALILSIVAAGLSLTAGCGSSTAVSGSVAFDGQPVANGAITFTPEDGTGPLVGGPITEGRYRIDQIAPGRKIVQVAGVKKVNFAHSHEEMAMAAKKAARQGDGTGIIDRADTIPPNAEGHNAVVEVVSGNQTLDFTLKSPAQNSGLKHPAGR